MNKKITITLPTDAEVEQWFINNIGIENDCSASSAIFNFRQWLTDRSKTLSLCPKCNWHIIEEVDNGVVQCYWCGKIRKIKSTI